MLGRWRDEFNAGRTAVRLAAARGQGAAARAQMRPPSRTTHGGSAGASVAADEVQNLRALLGELHQITELLQARIAELETELTATHWRAARSAEVLQLPGVRKVLVRVVHPDAHPEADEAQRAELTEAMGKINAAYDLIDRATDQTP